MSGSNHQSLGTRNINSDPPRWGAAPNNAPKQPKATSPSIGWGDTNATSSVGWGEQNKEGNGWGDSGDGWGEIASGWPGSSNTQEKSTTAGTGEKGGPVVNTPVNPAVSKSSGKPSDYDKMDVDPRTVQLNKSQNTPLPASPTIYAPSATPLSLTSASHPGSSSVSVLPRVPLPKTKRLTTPSLNNLTEIHAEILATRPEALPPPPSSLGSGDRSALFTSVIRCVHGLTFFVTL